MPGALSASSRPNKALADLFSCIGAGDVATAKVLLEATARLERAALLSATNPAGITLLQHACHAGQPDGVSMLLDKACATGERCSLETYFCRSLFLLCYPITVCIILILLILLSFLVLSDEYHCLAFTNCRGRYDNACLFRHLAIVVLPTIFDMIPTAAQELIQHIW